jgi:hypothetical protein
VLRILTPINRAIYPFVHSLLVLYFELLAWFKVFALELLFGVVIDSCNILIIGLYFDSEFLV